MLAISSAIRPGLRLIAASTELLRLELHSSAALAAKLNVERYEDWPPGEYDRQAIAFFLKQTEAGGEAALGWYSWYALYREDERASEALIGCGGFMGPADEHGQTGIGYSVCSP